MSKKNKAIIAKNPELKLLAAVAEGNRTNADLKKAMRKDVRSLVNRLIKDDSLEKIEGELILTKRGAGRLRFPVKAA